MKKMCCSLKHPPGRRSRYRDGKGEKVKRVNLSTRKMSNSFGEKEKKKGHFKVTSTVYFQMFPLYDLTGLYRILGLTVAVKHRCYPQVFFPMFCTPGSI